MDLQQPGNLPAPVNPTISIGSQKFPINPDAQKVLLTRYKDGSWGADELATMGESDVFVRRDGNNRAVLIYKVVKLLESKKEIANVGSKKDADKAQWIITVPGYTRLNQIAGIHVATPPSIFADGHEQANPYVQYDGNEIRRIVCRKIAIGYSPNGNLVAVDTIRHYNFDAYYLQDLAAKAKWEKDAAKFGISFSCPFDSKAEVITVAGVTYARNESRYWIFKKIKDVEGIWIDPTHEAIQEVYNQHIQHQKFGDVIGQNLCTRNALKAHPAIAAGQVKVTNGVAEVLVYGYRMEISKDQLQQVIEDVVRGTERANLQIVVDEAEEGHAEFTSATETEVDETQSPEQGGKGGPAKGDTSDELRTKVDAAVKEKDLNIVMICKNMFDTTYDKLTVEQLTAVLERIEKMGETKKKGGKQ